MGICNCPTVDQEDLVRLFMNDTEWNLECVRTMFNNGNSLEEIFKSVPFRGHSCNRTAKCCGVCTRKCYHRCIQDCLNRMYMWREASKYHKMPLSIELALKQKFTNPEDLSWVVSEIISSSTNTSVANYMKEMGLHHTENPNKLEYAPQVEIDTSTGKRVVDPQTGQLSILHWPTTGLCPFCTPDVTIDRRYGGRFRCEL